VLSATHIRSTSQNHFIVVRLFVISTYWSQDAFSLMLKMTSALIPYFLVAAQIANRGEMSSRLEQLTTWP
jgi:hypothetical protein